MPDVNHYLGPLLGFLFTAATLLFVAMNAHRTVPTELPHGTAPEPVPGDAAPPIIPTMPMGPDGTGEVPPTTMTEPNPNTTGGSTNQETT